MLDQEQPAAAFLIKVYHDYRQTMVEVNIWGAFAEIGLTQDITQDLYGLIFDEKKCRQSRGFFEFSQRDVSFESLSTRRQSARFGWINKPE
jgi:hypothetical protein